MKRSLSSRCIVAACSLALAPLCHATIVTVAEYQLGEPGTFSGSFIQDTSGNARHFGSGAGTITTTAGDTAAPGSTHYVTFDPADGNDGQWGADFSAIPNDNFALEAWARVSDLSHVAPLITTGNTTGRLKLQINNGNWASSLHGVGWVGATGGTGQPITPNVWTHIAVIRENGTSTFYIDGVAQAGTINNTPTFTASAHIGVEPGGSSWFNGDVDSVRVFTFDPNTDDPVAALNLAVIPEPATSALLFLGLAGLTRLRRR